MNEHIKKNINEMCSTIGENNTNDLLMVDKNVFTESEEIQSRHFENNLSEDDEKKRYSMKKYKNKNIRRRIN